MSRQGFGVFFRSQAKKQKVVVMYNSVSTNNFQYPQLFQSNPKYGDDDHQSWTESIISYRASARHHAAILKLNQRCKPRSDYRWWATISMTEELPAKEVCERWTKIRRMLCDAGIVAGWVTEVDPKTNRVHWHLVASQWPDFDSTYLILQTSQQKLKFKLKSGRIKPHQHCSLSASVSKYVTYICKAGDSHKPVLFQVGTGITKQGTIGKFYLKPKAVYEQYLKEKYSHRTSQGMKQPGALDLVRLLDGWFDGTESKRNLCFKIGTVSTVWWWSEVPCFELYRQWRTEVSNANYDGGYDCWS